MNNRLTVLAEDFVGSSAYQLKPMHYLIKTGEKAAY